MVNAAFILYAANQEKEWTLLKEEQDRFAVFVATLGALLVFTILIVWIGMGRQSSVGEITATIEPVQQHQLPLHAKRRYNKPSMHKLSLQRAMRFYPFGPEMAQLHSF